MVEGHDVNAVVTEMSYPLQSSLDRLLTGMARQVFETWHFCESSAGANPLAPD
jgi:hypothetical protein